MRPYSDGPSTYRIDAAMWASSGNGGFDHEARNIYPPPSRREDVQLFLAILALVLLFGGLAVIMGSAA